MTEAADRVTDYAFGELGWPCLWLSNAQENLASRRIKEKQGAQLVDIMIGRYVGGEALADGLAADARGLGRPPGGLSLAGRAPLRGAHT